MAVIQSSGTNGGYGPTRLSLLISVLETKSQLSLFNSPTYAFLLFVPNLHTPPQTHTATEEEEETKMSWQTYVDEHLMCEIDGQHLTAAAIIGHDGSVWAQSASFPQFKPDEITGIMKDFDEPGYLAPTGLHLGGTKYMVIQGESGAVIRGKKGSGGITIKKTNQALIFGIYDEPLTPGQCNMIVERLGDYLVEQGL